MILSFHPVVVSDVQIILGDRPLDSRDLAQMQKAEAIILPQSCSGELYRACRESSARVFPNYDRRYDYEGKVGQSRLFEEMGWPHPATLRWNSVQEFEEYRLVQNRMPHRFPFFLKRDICHEGQGVFLVRAFSDLEPALDHIRKRGDSGFVSQEFICSQGNVLRVVIMGRRTFTYWKRPSMEGSLITNISSGSKIDTEWMPDLQEKGRSKATGIARQGTIDLAALDFVYAFNELGPRPLLLEINYYFGRRGLGGSARYYRMLIDTIREWLEMNGLDPQRVSLA